MQIIMTTGKHTFIASGSSDPLVLLKMIEQSIVQNYQELELSTKELLSLNNQFNYVAQYYGILIEPY